MRKFLYFIIFMLAVAGLFNYLINRQPTVPNSAEDQTTLKSDLALGVKPTTQTPTNPQNSIKDTPAVAPALPEKKLSEGAEAEPLAPDILVVQVDFDGEKFSPATVNLKVGDFVIFKNNSKSPMWPASNPHPTHSLYSEFDPKQAIQAGGKWQFEFKKSGEWPYHNHLNSQMQGVIIVK